MKNLLRVFITSAFLLPLSQSFGQGLPCPPVTNTTVSAGPDVTICPNQCATLSAVGNAVLPPSTASYALDSPFYTSYAYNSGTTVPITTDDTYGPLMTLPFAFCYYGTKYTTCVVGSNGQISFNPAVANGGCPWVINGGVPGVNATSGNSTLNCIMAPFYDILPGNNTGTIKYAVYGQAPCRVYVVSWDSLRMFSCTNEFGFQQIVLHESTYQIDINVRAKPPCPGWNSGRAILGIQNAAGTASVMVPGYNGTAFSMYNKSYTFIPNGPSGTATGAGYRWYTLGGNQVGTGLTATVCPLVTTDYVLRAEFYSGCDTIRKNDTVRVIVSNSVVVSFTYNIKWGCSGDTVQMVNTSTGGASWNWDFGDGFGDTAKNPKHIYLTQGNYNIRLIGSGLNAVCKDTIVQPIDLLHPLDASFTVDDDSICQNQLVTFTNTSVTTTKNNINPTFFWTFGDGGTSTQQSPTYTYVNPGYFKVTMYVTDFVPCTDTYTHYILVDTLPYIDFTVSKNELCLGQGIFFTGDYMLIGNTGTMWDFGDGTKLKNRNNLTHAYDQAGTFDITYTGTYRICPDISAKKTVTIKPFPHIDLGPDTTMCPNAEPINISDHYADNASNGATYLWNTGHTNNNITVKEIGRYSATVTLNGCSAADSVDIRKDCYINIPNVFSPNGDGVNDYFLPRQFLSKSVTSYKMSVFNRWGQLIFQGTNPEGRGWDGKFNDVNQPNGVYVYIIDVAFTDTRKEHYEGNITLMR